MLCLRELQIADECAFRDAVGAWPATEPMTFAPAYDGGRPFSEYVALLQAHARGESLPSGWVPSVTLFGFAGPEIVGRLQLRLQLNDFS